MTKKKIQPRTQELLDLMQKHVLNQTRVAEIIGCTQHMVHYYTTQKKIIPDYRLRLLKLSLADKAA